MNDEMENQSSWPPPPTNQAQQNDVRPKPYFSVWVPLLAVGLGFGLALLDVYRADNLVDWLTFGAAALLGFLQPKTFWLSVFILSFSLYLVHVFAISHGFQTPYVEKDTDEAINCWLSLLPNGLGGLIGAVAKLFEEYQR